VLLEPAAELSKLFVTSAAINGSTHID
jgi:hypothetical protein